MAWKPLNFAIECLEKWTKDVDVFGLTFNKDSSSRYSVGAVWMSSRYHLDIEIEIREGLIRKLFPKGFGQNVFNMISVVEERMRVAEPSHVSDVKGVPVVDRESHMKFGQDLLDLLFHLEQGHGGVDLMSNP